MFVCVYVCHPDTDLCCEAFAANVALEGPLFGVASHVNLEGGVAGKDLVAEGAGGPAPASRQHLIPQAS